MSRGPTAEHRKAERGTFYEWHCRVFWADWARTFQRRRTEFIATSVLRWCIAPARPDAILFLAFLGR